MIGESTTFAVDGDVVIRLLAAALIGGLIGAEREASDQPAGLRTHIAVALGASLFGVISTLGFLEFDQERANSTIQADVTRVASNVAVGIGFLGAGVIFRQGSNVRNLTTAASLWTVAAIGLACGVGDVTTGVIGAAVLLVSLVLLRPIRTYIRRHWTTTTSTVRLELREGADPDDVVDRFRDAHRLETAAFQVRKDGGRIVILGTVEGHPAAVRSWVARMATSPDVESLGEQ
ncbi:MAG TPA: MgtC/SapB family protein [Acidimicrobiales bacterium]|nr:MgtC/SapB family protein [Acidimicrobiales bacterium]